MTVLNLNIADKLYYGNFEVDKLYFNGQMIYPIGTIGLEDNSPYCPQDTTGFYDINFTILPKETTSPYCPQDTTGFYDFSQAP